MGKINVTRTFLPPLDEYQDYLRQIWDNSQLTNQGPLLQEFEKQAKQYLGINDFQFVANGTLALQVALQALDITDGEVITTPFSYVASTSALLWQRCEPVFVDIEPDSLCIDAGKIEAAITSRTKAILAVHVFGNPCDVEKISEIARRRNLKVIYDAAHAFGVQYQGKSLLSYGDVSVCSFHATKLFHTIEGGAVISADKTISGKAELIKRFGHTGDEHFMLGINAKASEFQAAMGLCNLKYIDEIIAERKQLSELYGQELGSTFSKPAPREGTTYNYAYYPVLLDSEARLMAAIDALSQEDIFPRRYFYPSLNTLPYIEGGQACPVSEDISGRILCLPLYNGLDEGVIKKISGILRGL